MITYSNMAMDIKNQKVLQLQLEPQPPHHMILLQKYMYLIMKRRLITLIVIPKTKQQRKNL